MFIIIFVDNMFLAVVYRQVAKYLKTLVNWILVQ